MSETWENSKQVIDGILAKCTRIWLDFDKEGEGKTRQERSQEIRCGLAIVSRYLRVLRMEDAVANAEANKELIEAAKERISQLEAKLDGQEAKKP